MVTITGVKMSRDLRIARVYFTTSGGPKNKAKAEKGFNSAIGYAKHSIAQELGLRYTPDLKFSYDESFDYGSHIDKVLKTIKTDDESNNTPFEK